MGRIFWGVMVDFLMSECSGIAKQVALVMNSICMSKPTVISFCATFLKAEMQHIYRQVTGLQRYRTTIVTQQRQNESLYPFEDVLCLPKASIGLLRRGWLKYISRVPSLIYRGEYEALLRILDGHPADLMHVYFGHAGVHLLPFIERWDRPVVISFHGMDAMPRPRERRYDASMLRLLQVVPLVLVRSRSLEKVLIARGCPPEKIRINRTSVPLGAFSLQRREVPADGAWHLVQASRFIEKKGLDLTLRAFAEFRKIHPQARLTLIGEGPLKEQLQQLAGSLGVTGAVRFPGFLRPEEMLQEFAGAHLFLHPSRLTAGQDQEGVPNSMLEAMATGLPVVATRHGGIPEAVTDHETGLLSPEEDVAGLVCSLNLVASDPKFWQRLGNAAAISVAREFDSARSIHNLENFYDEARQSHVAEK